MTHYITRHDGYEYASLALATTFLLPQTVHSFRTRKMDDVSALSLISVTLSSALWAVFMHENQLETQAYATLFVTFNSAVLLIGKAWLYATAPKHTTLAQRPIQLLDI